MAEMRALRLCCFWLALAGVVFLPAGCRPPAPVPKDRVPPNPSAPARYGPPTGVASKEIPRALSLERDTNWQSAPFWILRTELSPAILVHSKTRYLGLFAPEGRQQSPSPPSEGGEGRGEEGLSPRRSAGREQERPLSPSEGEREHAIANPSQRAEQEFGAPAHIAWSTRDGPRAFKPGTTHDVTGMEENWLLVWFAGAQGWTNWDSPWAAFLQHKPTWLRLDERGLHLEFPARAGDVVVMPLYGYFKLPPRGRDFLAEHGLKSRKLFSWEWEKGLARDPLTRLRYWAGASRQFPIYCEESFSVDRARDELTVRSRIEWHSIRDDWGTKPVKLAPVSPVLALAARDKDFPAHWSKPFFDMHLPTWFGPYAGVEDADTFDVTFPWLHYVHETEAAQSPDTNAHPAVARAAGKLREVVEEYVAEVERNERERQAAPKPRGFFAEFARTISEAFAEINESLSRNAVESLSNGVPANAAWLRVLALDPDHSEGDRDFQQMWACCHFTGDWKLARLDGNRPWSDFLSEITGAWSAFGVADQGQPTGEWNRASALNHAAECVAAARLAYRGGDMDGYHYACLRAVQALTYLWARQRGAEYFRRQQPWHSSECMDEPVFLHGLTREAGWVVMGANFPKRAHSLSPSEGERGYSISGQTQQPEERPSSPRPSPPSEGGERVSPRGEGVSSRPVRSLSPPAQWPGFFDLDTARFCRDWLRDDFRRELNRAQAQQSGAQSPSNRVAWVPVRGLLLNETVEQLSAVAGPEPFNETNAQVVAACLAVLRASRPVRYERLIPPGEPSPFVAGPERAVREAGPSLVTALHTGGDGSPDLRWPRLTWPQWKSPGGGPWSFGAIKPARDGQPVSVQKKALNWNTEVVVYELP